MNVSGATSIAAQEISANKMQTGFDALTKTIQKTEQGEINSQQRMEIAQQTGKGVNIDVKA